MATIVIKCISGNVRGQAKVEAEKPGIVTFHIYHDGRIEKHIPKFIKAGYEHKYKYVFHTLDQTIHNLCVVEWIETNKMKKGNILVEGEKVELIDVRQFKGYKGDNLSIKFRTMNSDSGRFYISPECFASLLGAMGILNIDDLGFNGFSDEKARSVGGSKSHLNGACGDLRYLSTNKDGGRTLLSDKHFDFERQKEFCEALHLFGWSADGKSKMLSEIFLYKGKQTILPHCLHYNKNGVRHNNHLHLQGFKQSIVKEVKL